MREAFNRARKDNPNSPIVPVIQYVNRVQAEERRFGQLTKQFKEVGLMWFGTRIDQSVNIFYRYDSIPIEQKREKWTQTLTSLRDKPPEERIELLKALASGMQLTGNHDPRVYAQSILQIEFDNPLGFLRDEFLGVNFTLPSKLFIEAIGDMSGHSREQQEKFREFMIKKSGLKGRVELYQLFPGISRWLDHSKSQQPKHDP